MFLVSNEKENAMACLQAVQILHSEDDALVKTQLQNFIETHLPAGEKIDLLLSGENGNDRLLKYYTACENLLGEDVTIARYKHMSGEYNTASSIGVWLACQLLQQQQVPLHMIKRNGKTSSYKNILLYNNCRGSQHGFILITQVL